jgi:hypothetical protein
MVAEWIAVFLLCGMASAQVGTALVIPMNAAWGDKQEELTLSLQVVKNPIKPSLRYSLRAQTGAVYLT